jgi:di/tripeptidase
MSSVIGDLEPRVLFRHFAALVATPRGSGNEAAAREYVVSFARERGFDARVDVVGNVVVGVPATLGHENAPTVVLQGHLDIVCEKNSDIAHDFLNDPIPAWVDGDMIRARGTTLGADNGVGVSAALAVAEDPDCVHGPLEILCTVDEETGMSGAFGLKASMLKGRIMLNLDSEDEGTLFIGCAGGGDSLVRLPVQRTAIPAGAVGYTVKVSGLKGGHSGLDICRNRGNALRILARALVAGAGIDGVHLACIAGGSKRNAIPREATACVWIPAQYAPAFEANVAGFAALIKAELGTADPGVVVGTGAIGHRVARLGHCLGMGLLGYDAQPAQTLSDELGMRYAPLAELFAKSDVVTLHAPLTPDTQGLVDAALLRRLPATAIIINTARAGLIRQDDLYEALSEQVLAGAGLDVIDLSLESGPRLLALDTVVSTPHIGFYTHEALAQLTAVCVDNVVRFIDGAPLNVAALPLVPADGQSGVASAPEEENDGV